MKKRMGSFVLCLLLLICCGADALAAQHGDPGFYDVGSASGLVIEPLLSSGEPANAVLCDVDGDGVKEDFYPNSVMLRVTVPAAESGKQYMIQVRDAETGEVLYVDQQAGVSPLRFTADFLLPDRNAELRLIVSSTDGSAAVSVPLRCTPGAASEQPGPGPVPPWQEPVTGYIDCPGDKTCAMTAFSDLDPAAWYHDGIHFVLENGIMNGYDGGIFGPDRSTSRAMIVTMLWRMEGRPTGGDVSFRDVPDGTWYSEAVGWASSEHIVDGYGPDRFGPDDNATREQLAAILWRYARYKGMDVSDAEDTDIGGFDDASAVSAWAVGAMRWACGAGIIHGTGNGLISPRLDATRAQVATMLMRFSVSVSAQRDRI